MQSRPYPTRNLYLTAMAELPDDALLDLVADASIAVAQGSGRPGAERGFKKDKALLDAARTACTLYSMYEKRIRERRSALQEVRANL